MCNISFLLCLPMQRYKFESNSQPREFLHSTFVSCVYLCKDTNLKAIHNAYCYESYFIGLCLPMQRYKFESNSQHISQATDLLGSCVYLCKDTNLKAIHNLCEGFVLGVEVVFTYAKIQIWKQFTTVFYCSFADGVLCLPMQRYKFESNSQHIAFKWRYVRGCVYLCKDTNLKAIHNHRNVETDRGTVVFTYAKIQIWKQFTTCAQMALVHLWLCLPMQRYKFESNSQLITCCHNILCCCVYLCKDTNLKAIHNSYRFNSFYWKVVFTYAKIQIWKQFTTINAVFILGR